MTPPQSISWLAASAATVLALWVGATISVTSGLGCSPKGGARGAASHAADAAASEPGFEVLNVAQAQALQVLHHQGETFALVREGSWEFWIKTPTQAHDAPIKPGDLLLIGHGERHVKLRHEGLARTFEEVLDVGQQIKVVTQAQSDRFIRVTPPPEGLSLEALYAQRQALAGEQVVVRGRVVKVNRGIFGAHWYHVQDGSGAKAPHDLTITSSDEAQLGQIITARGQLTIDHDLGFGYFYDAILLDAKIDGAKADPTLGERPGDQASGLIGGAPSAAKAGEAKVGEAKAGAAALDVTTTSQAPIDWEARIAAQQAQRLEGVTTPAPTRQVFGLTLGQSDAAQLTQWLKARGLDCPAEPSSRRMSTRHDCVQGLSGQTLPERPSAGRLTQILLSYGDDEPLGQVSVTRDHGDAMGAIQDYTSTVQAVREALGSPQQHQPITTTAPLKGELVRFVTTWQHQDLRAQVVLMKLGRATRVIERWEHMSVRRHRERPGAKPIHGQPLTLAANPHIKKPLR